MARGFLSGIIGGTVVGLLGTAAMSLLSDLPPGAGGAPEVAETEGAASLEPLAPEGTPQIPSADIPDEDVPLIGLSDPADGDNQDTPDPERESAEAPDVDAPDVAMNAPEDGSSAPNVPQTEQSDGAEGIDLALAPEAPAAFAAPDIDTTSPERPGQNDDAEEPGTPVEDIIVEEGTGIGDPVDGFTDQAPNVTINRLPSIGDEDQVAEIVTEDAAPDGADILGALTWNAVPFENIDGKPVYSIILIEAVDGDLTPNAAAQLGFPITVVIDATSAGAEARAEAYRAAGQEVMFSLSLPDGASPVDVEVAFERASSTIPLAVAVMDQAEGGFGSNRMLAQHVIAIAAQSGHGVVGHGKGLNSITQLADRDGVPAALSFRVFDDQQQSGAVIQRYLDRAAFRAQQEGYVVMVGHGNSESITAISEWATGERAASMALAPISAVLRRNQ